MSQNYNSVSFLSPAKIIITGEYSGIFGGKFLSTSINLYTKCKITKSNFLSVTSKKTNQKKQDLTNFFKSKIFPKLESKNQKVLIEFESNIPESRGMGSSAAFVNSFLMNYLELCNKEEQNPLDILETAIKLEDLFHHKSSGIDIYTSLFGGLIISDKKIQKKLDLEFNFSKENIFIIDAGKKIPTSRSVSYVLKNFKESDKIWDDFSEINNLIIDKIENHENYSELIKENQILLEKLGVVPLKTSLFIKELEKNNCYGKISGSGSVDKNSGSGIIIAIGEFEKIKRISAKFGFNLINTNRENLGTHREVQKISSPGKLVLFGEHAVLHNKSAISIAINKRLKIEFSTNWTEKINIESAEKKLISEWKNFKIKKSDYFYKIFSIIKNFKFKTGFTIKINSQIPSGLGSSGTISTCIIAGLLRLKNFSVKKDEIFEKSKLFLNKSSSGIDIATSIYGGLIFFKIGKKPKILSKRFPKIYAIYSGVKTQTSRTISVINKNVSKEKQGKIFNKINKIVLLAKKSILNQNFEELNPLISENQKYLKDLHLVDKNVQQTIDRIEENKIKNYKISGSGLGDYLITFDEKAKNIGLEVEISEGIKYE